MLKRLVITGYGNVAKELVKLIHEQQHSIKKQYGIHLSINGIVGSKGMIYKAQGLDLATLLTCGQGSEALSTYAHKTNIELTKPMFEDYDTLIECSPTDMDSGEPGLSYIHQAIEQGIDIVSVSKGALVHSFTELFKKAKFHQVNIKYSGATAAALPTLDIGEYSLAGCTITKIEGILNGTSNFILSSMAEAALSFSEALSLAQEKGIAEANPALDVQGIDSAAKILLLANGLLGTQFTINDVEITGIEHVTKENMMNAQAQGKTIKLIASAEKVDQNTFKLSVKPQKLALHHPLAHVNGTNKGIVFDTIEMGTICTTGGASHPRGAAAAALKDVINLYRTDR